MERLLLNAVNDHPDLITLSWLKDVPLLHYTDYPEEILKHGFKYCRGLDALAWSYDKPVHDSGYIFAFWVDGVQGTRGIRDIDTPYNDLPLMKRKACIRFTGSGLYVHHKADQFNQVILHSSTVDLSQATIEEK